jgi:hypothetical protein
MTTSNNSFSEALAAIFIPIVEEGVRRALHANSYEPAPEACAAKEFLTIEQAADLCGLGTQVHYRVGVKQVSFVCPNTVSPEADLSTAR